jgi:hypothetical protein
MTRKRFAFFSWLLPIMLFVASSAAFAQNGSVPEYRKGSIGINFGKAEPRGDLSDIFKQSFLLGFDVGYRPVKYFQFDAGVDLVGGAAGVSRTIFVRPVGGGPVETRKIKDREIFVPFGGRLVLPLVKNRILLSGGGGFSYVRYAETPVTEGNETIECYSCSSRTGWGPYQVASVQFILDKNKHFGIGVTGKWYQVTTKGGSISTSIGERSRDRFFNLGANLGFYF